MKHCSRLVNGVEVMVDVWVVVTVVIGVVDSVVVAVDVSVEVPVDEGVVIRQSAKVPSWYCSIASFSSSIDPQPPLRSLSKPLPLQPNALSGSTPPRVKLERTELTEPTVSKHVSADVPISLCPSTTSALQEKATTSPVHV